MGRLGRTLIFVSSAAMLVACGATGSTPGSQASSAGQPLASPSAAVSAAPSVTPEPSVATSPSASTQTAPAVTLTEWKVTVTGTIKAGKTDVLISNIGVAQHELLVFKSALAPSAYPTDKTGDIIEDGPGVALLSDGDNIDPGGSQTRTVDLAPGTYLFVCNIPSHFKQGMFTVVTVAP